MPPPPMLLTKTPDPAMDKWRIRIGVAGLLLLLAYMAVLPVLAS